MVLNISHFSQWDQIFDDNMMTVAAIDRIVYPSYLEMRDSELS